MAKLKGEKRVGKLVYLDPEHVLKIEWLQEATPASFGYYVRKALDEFLADVRPPGLENRP